ncbi:hypothetical protein [Sodalis sp. RH19]|uniref:hypothetical protein n=1 Tax=Sodalis sp. RH19 TaxID=3394334 RepID=UPI0039B42509
MENKQKIILITHFYYCLLIAIKIAKRDKMLMTDNAMKLYIHRWLKNAQEKKIFHKIIYNEISWLRAELNCGDSSCFEEKIKTIYTRCQQISDEHNKD